MPREDHNRYERVEAQVKRVRALYSQIGEPLPADVIIDLHRCLGPALEAVSTEKKDNPRLRRGMEA